MYEGGRNLEFFGVLEVSRSSQPLKTKAVHSL